MRTCCPGTRGEPLNGRPLAGSFPDQVDRTTSELEINGAIRGRVATTNAFETHQCQQHEFNEVGRVPGGRIMIVTSKQARPEIEHAAATGELISDDVAQTIASWWHSPAAPDSPITACSHGLPFDPAALYARLGVLRTFEDQSGSDALRELDVLRAWTLARLPHLVVTTDELDADTRQTGSGQ
jgi:hypothetical protein